MCCKLGEIWENVMPEGQRERERDQIRETERSGENLMVVCLGAPVKLQFTLKSVWNHIILSD